MNIVHFASSLSLYFVCLLRAVTENTCLDVFVQFQLVSGTPSAGGSPQVVQISQGQGGQRLAVPLKLLLQPQVQRGGGYSADVAGLICP